MGWRRATTQKSDPQATGLSQLKEGLRRISENFEPYAGEFSEALKQYVHDLDPKVQTELPESKTLQAISDACALLLQLRQVTTV